MPFGGAVFVRKFIAFIHGSVTLLRGAEFELPEFVIADQRIAEILHGMSKTPDFVRTVVMRNLGIDPSGGDPVGGLGDFEQRPDDGRLYDNHVEGGKRQNP